VALLTLVPPASEPVAFADVKQFARVDHSLDDVLWASFIASARNWCEVYCQRRFVLQTMRLLMDYFPGYIDYKMAGQKVSSPFVSGANAVLVGIRYGIQLPYPRVRAVLNFQYQDANGGVQQMTVGGDSGQYAKDLSSQPARLTPPFGQMWPVARVIPNAVQIDYTTGYGGKIKVGIAATEKLITGATFPQDYVGLALCITGAGTGGNVLNTTIASIDSNGNATAADAAVATVAAADAWLGDPVPEDIKVAIMRLATYSNDNRNLAPDDKFILSVKRMLAPFRDVRL
jgi:hypothetical protein